LRELDPQHIQQTFDRDGRHRDGVRAQPNGALGRHGRCAFGGERQTACGLQLALHLETHVACCGDGNLLERRVGCREHVVI
jgi:hypothetical protein